MGPEDLAAVRAGFGWLAVAVAVITVTDGGEPHGCTGMAWAEHTDPPLLLTTLRRGRRTGELVRAAGRFGVSVLTEEQAGLARTFAGRPRGRGGRFAGVPVTRGPRRGVPLLAAAAAAFECDVEGRYPFGGHEIIVGRVAWASAAAGAAPLVHAGGSLWSLAGLGQATRDGNR